MAAFIVILYLIALYVRPQDWVPGMVGLPTAMLIIPLGLVVGFVARAREPEKFRAPQTWLMCIYLGVIFIATLVNVSFSQAFEQADAFARRIAVFFMIIWLLTTRERLRVTIWTVMLLSAFLAYQAILQATEGASWGGLTTYPGYEMIRVRWYGDWDGPNVFGLLFVIACGITFEYMFGPHGLLTRLVAAACTASYVVAIFYTNSRGAVLALGCMVLFYFRSRFKSKFAIVFAVLAIATLAALGPSRMSEVNSKESSARERTWLWEQGLALLKANPVLGVGRGEFYKRVDLGLIAHNNYVQNFAELGFAGFFLFMSIIWFCFIGNYQLSRPEFEVSPPLVAYSRMCTSILVGYLATTFFVVMELDLLYFVFGLCTAVYLVARRESPLVPTMSLARKDVIVVGAAMIGIIVMIWLAAIKHIV